MRNSYFLISCMMCIAKTTAFSRQILHYHCRRFHNLPIFCRFRKICTRSGVAVGRRVAPYLEICLFKINGSDLFSTKSSRSWLLLLPSTATGLPPAIWTLPPSHQWDPNPKIHPYEQPNYPPRLYWHLFRHVGQQQSQAPLQLRRRVHSPTR